MKNSCGGMTDCHDSCSLVQRVGSRKERCRVSVFPKAEQNNIDPRDMRFGAKGELAQDVFIVLSGSQGVFGFALHPINVIRSDPQGLKQGRMGHGEIASWMVGWNASFVSEEKKNPGPIELPSPVGSGQCFVQCSWGRPAGQGDEASTMGSDGIFAGGVDERGGLMCPFLAITHDMDVGFGRHVSGDYDAASLRLLVCGMGELPSAPLLGP